MSQSKHIDVRRSYEFRIAKKADWFIESLFRRRLLKYNEDYDSSDAEILEISPSQKIVYKWIPTSFDCSLSITDTAVLFYSNDRLIETVSPELSNVDISFLKAADKSLKLCGGPGRLLSDGSEQNFPWLFVLSGHAWQVIQ